MVVHAYTQDSLPKSVEFFNMLHYFIPRTHVQVKNPYLDTMEEDILYHFSLSTKTHNLPEMFGDIKVCEKLINKLFCVHNF